MIPLRGEEGECLGGESVDDGGQEGGVALPGVEFRGYFMGFGVLFCRRVCVCVCVCVCVHTNNSNT